MTRFQQRRDQLRKLIRKQGLEALLVSDFTNVTYLTGFTGDDSLLLLHDHGEVVLSDPRYTIQLQEECPGLDLEIRRPGTTLMDAIERTIKEAKLGRVAIEADMVTLAMYDQLKERTSTLDWVSTRGLVEQLREIKDRDEVAEIRNAIEIAEKAFGVVRAALRGEQTEKQIADEIEHQIRLFGGRGCSFTPIVGVGDRAALAHYQPGERRVSESPLLLIDWGAIGRLYVSDLTRVLVTGRPSARLRKIYDTVLAAQRMAISKIRPGTLMQDIDAAARGVIEKAGFGRRFGHSLGHGIGLQVHEQPRLAMREKRALQPGMVVTVEPGIYLPGWGGVRIEDDVLVTRDGHEVLTSVDKEFDQCIVGVL
jgi:Xaa-Pro aminopeptidase